MVARMANYHARLAAAEQRTRNVWRAGMDSSVQLTMVELGPGQATNTTEQARHEFSSSPFLILHSYCHFNCLSVWKRHSIGRLCVAWPS